MTTRVSRSLRKLPFLLTGEPPIGARAILSDSGSLVGAIAVGSLLGFLYWSIAARAFPPNVVGFAAAAVAAMTLLGTLGMLGLGTLLTGELASRDNDRASRLATGLALAALAGFTLGLIFAVAAPGPLSLEALGHHPAPIALFATGVALTSAAMVLDQALIGLHRGGLQLLRNGLHAAIKLVLVGIVAGIGVKLGGLGLYATWVAGLAASLLWLALFAVPRGNRRAARRLRWSLISHWRSAALKHHFLNVALQAPPLALPVVAAATVSVAATAYYYTASLIAGVLAFGAIALSYALYATGARNPENFSPALRFTLRISFLVVITANIVLAVGAHFILQLFGPEYSSHGTTVLRLLGAAVLLQVIKDHYVAISRIRGTILAAGIVCAIGAALEIGLGALGGVLGGLNWLAAGPLAALVLEMFVMCPTVIREIGWTSRGRVSRAQF
jgi:O-antigen/teichoic acid export membrane protein